MLDSYARLTNRIVRRVNEQRGLGRRTRDAIAPRRARTDFIAAVRSVAALSAGSLAEASMRIRAGVLLVTAAGAPFDRLADGDVLIDADDAADGWGRQVLPYHASWHRQIYTAYDHVGAIVLTQPPAALRLAHAGRTPESTLLSRAAAVCGGVAVVDPVPQSSAEAVVAAAATAGVLLVPGIGMLVSGTDIAHAVDRTHIAARWCDLDVMHSG